VRTSPNPDFEISWHEEDTLRITIENYYDYTVPLPLPDRSSFLHRKGKDSVQGVLARNQDGTYSGILHARSSGTASGQAFLGLAGVAECDRPDISSGKQDVYVIGERVGAVSLLLRFYPASIPEGHFTNCQALIDYAGDDIAGFAAGKYVPLNDTRWESPDVGIEIPIPDSPGDIIDQYEDKYLYQPDDQMCSVFYITVIWPDPKATADPTIGPPPEPHLCE
jgi:hypothetical protein